MQCIVTVVSMGLSSGVELGLAAHPRSKSEQAEMFSTTISFLITRFVIGSTLYEPPVAQFMCMKNEI